MLAVEINKEDWIDIGSPWNLLEANEWILKKADNRINGNIENGAHLIGPVIISKTAKIRSGAYIEGPAFIDEGSDI